MRVSSEEEELGLDESQHNEKYLQGHLLVSSNGASHTAETEKEKGTIYTS
jgi:Amt family ammonium transporter